MSDRATFWSKFLVKNVMICSSVGKFKKRWFGPFKVQYCLPNNIVFVFVNNFELNPILVNINKLKPYSYVDKTLKGIQSFKIPKSLRI